MASTLTCDWCGHEMTDSFASSSDRVSLQPLGNPGRSWPFVDLHQGCLRDMATRLGAANAESHRVTPRPNASDRDDWRRGRDREWEESRAGWTQLTKLARERLILETLGDEGYTVPELVTKLAAEHERRRVHYSDVYPVVRCLLFAGEVRRVSEPVRRTRKAVWRYFRQAELRGPIAELERVVNDPTDENEGPS